MATPIVLSAISTPLGRLYAGFKDNRIASLASTPTVHPKKLPPAPSCRLRRRVVQGQAPPWLVSAIERFFSTWKSDDAVVDISNLTPFEQAALRARLASRRRSSFVRMGRDADRTTKAARAVGRVMARNPLPLLFPCHRVVDSSSARPARLFLWTGNEGAAFFQMEGYRG